MFKQFCCCLCLKAVDAGWCFFPRIKKTNSRLTTFFLLDERTYRLMAYMARVLHWVLSSLGWYKVCGCVMITSRRPKKSCCVNHIATNPLHAGVSMAKWKSFLLAIEQTVYTCLLWSLSVWNVVCHSGSRVLKENCKHFTALWTTQKLAYFQLTH